MKKLILLFICCLLLTACGAEAEGFSEQEDKASAEAELYYVSKITWAEGSESEAKEDSGRMNAIWVSQFDMKPIYRNGTKQREEQDYRSKVETMMGNLVRDGFNTVFLQVRPNGDSMFESEIYPLSKYVAGYYGGKTAYDAVGIYLEIAKEHGISVHAWINPFRLCLESELKNATGKLAEWSAEIGTRIILGTNGVYYLNPAFEEATDLIASGAKEILIKYPQFEGIHIDDYFYPTEFDLDDDAQFKSSGYSDKGEFRRANVTRTVKALYRTVHEFDNKVFGISPAGNITSLPKKWYADINLWLSETGYTDYIMPQLYYGFDNAACPFDKTLTKWQEAVKCDEIKLYIGLSAAKCVYGSQGKADNYAGEKGQYEWRDNKNILARSLELINKQAEGFCIFTYSSFYSVSTGERNELSLEEATNFFEALKG